MRKYGQVTHLLLTAALGVVFWALTEVLFFGFGRMIFAGLVNIVPSVIIVILHFALFCGSMYGAMFLLCKMRGDYKGWADKNLLEVVTTNFKHAAIALVIVVVASGIFEFVYELDIKAEVATGGNASSYVFIIDDSTSMRGNDPSKARVQAVKDTMQGSSVPYAVYRFGGSNTATLVKSMGKYSASDVLDFPTDLSSTDILDALNTVLDDIESGALNVGNNPRVLLLSDGGSSDYGLEAVTDRCKANNIVVSTISYSFNSPLLSEIATLTGGVYSEVYDASTLGSNMQSGLEVRHHGDRNLLGDWTGDILHAIMRVVMLALLGLGWSWMKQKAYCCAYEHKFADTVFLVSVILTTVAAILVECLFRFTPVPGFVIRLIFCVLWAITPGIYWGGFTNTQNNMYSGGFSNQGTFGNYDKRSF